MKNNENNVAYIDGANLHKGIETLDWEFDYRRFRVWLKEKYKIGFILSPYETEKCSILLKRTGVKISYISDQKNILKKNI